MSKSKKTVTIEEKFDIYISYDYNSKTQIRQLYDKLTALYEFKIWLDEVEIDLDRNLNKQLMNGIRESKLFMCCLTNDYTFSDTSVDEITLAEELKKPFLVLLLEDDKDLLSYLDSQISQNQLAVFNCFQDTYFFDHLSGDLFNSILFTINQYLNMIKTASLSKSNMQMKSNIPNRNKTFTGRDNYLEEIENYLINSNQQILLITGLSGCGKTDLALEFAHRKRETSHFKAVRWFNADSSERIDIEFKFLIAQLGLDWCLNMKSLFICLLRQFIERMSQSLVLFIFDNLKQINDIRDYLTDMPSNLKIIITSEKSNLFLQDSNCILKLNLLRSEEADDYLKSVLKLRNISFGEASDILRYLQIQDDYVLPFYLNEVACFLRETKALRLSQYVEMLNSDANKDLVEDSLFEIEKCENAWIAYQYFAYLDNDFINLEIVKELLPTLNENELHEIFKLLEVKGCIRLVNEHGMTGFRMHKLKQEELLKFIHKYPDNALTSKEIYLVLLEIISRLFPSVNKNYGSNWIRAKYFYFHAKKLVKNYKSVLDRESDSVPIIYSRMADFNKHILLDAKNALNQEESRLKICTSLFEMNQDVIDSYFKIAEAYMLMQDTKNAIFYFDKTIKLNNQNYPQDLSLIAMCLYMIGLCYQKIGEFKSEINFKEQAIKFYAQATTNETNKQVANILDDIARRLLSKGDIENSLKYSMKALDLRNELDEQDMLSMSKTLFNLGACYFKQHDYLKAMEFHEQAMQLRQMLVEENKCCKLLLAQSFNAVGSCYRNEGDVLKGFELLDQEVNIKTEIFGHIDPNYFKFNIDEDLLIIQDD